MTEALEDAGIDPDFTPTDRMPEAGLWAMVADFNEQNGVSNDE